MEIKNGCHHNGPNTVKPVYNDHLMGHIDELQEADIVSKSKLVPSVFIITHYCR